jgi:sterol desaturase/sphingolipid hydroxylase (fatty acid hydroxylase superfamily)
VEAFLTYLATKLTVGKAIGFLIARTVQLATIALVFVPLERLVPFHPKQRLFRPQFGVDLLHFFVGGALMVTLIQLTYFLMPLISGWADVQPLNVRGLPVWAQLLLFEAGWTFLGYWLHRFEHVWRPLWRLHSIHESTEELDWLSAFRLHPLEPTLFHVLTIIPLWFFGMSAPVVIGYKLYWYVFSHVQHSNVVFPIGPLKYVFPTPQFHRWHHARVLDENGRPVRSFCNFSAYPIWDLLFGTFYLPNKTPLAYGNAPGVPASYLAQLAYPFGVHKAVIAWERSSFGRLRFSDRLARFRATIAPVHEAFERRLGCLSLLRSGAASGGSPIVAPQSLVRKE